LKPFSLIAAVDSKGGIGRDQTLPWKLREDMAFFRAVTTHGRQGVGLFVPDFQGETLGEAPPQKTQNVVIMGRKTWVSLPKKHRPLAERQNIVLSRTQSDLSEAPTCDSLERALALPTVLAAPEIFIIGGAAVFAEAILHPLCHRVILTRIEGDFGCDVFFPAMPTRFHCMTPSAWHSEIPTAGAQPIRFRFEIWV